MDINTIFYFPSSLTFEEYSNKLNQGEISERTIVFADAQKAIYKGGKKYGGTSVQEFHDLIDTLYDDSWISDEINGIKDDVLQSIARLDLFNTIVTNVSSRLDTEIQERDNNIQAKVEELMEDADWLQEKFPQGVTQWDARWNQNLEAYLQTVGYWTTDDNNQTITQWSKLRQDLNSILASVNSLKVDGNLTQALTTSIQQLITDKIASLQLGTTYATVEKVDGVEKLLEWMYSGLESSASEDMTFAEMSSMAKNDFISAISDIRTQVNKVADGDFVAQTELASKVGDTIATMLLQSSSDNGLAGMAARLTTVEQDTGAISQNVADLILGVTGSSSTADLATRVANKLAGFTTSTDIDTAKAEVYSAISAKDGSGNFISLAALKAQSDADHSSVSAIASRVGVLETNEAGFVASADLDSSVASLFSRNSNTKASVTTEISDSVNTAKTEIYSAISAKDGNDNFISIANLKTQSDADHSSISAVASRVSDLETNEAGYLATSNLDSSVASLFSRNSSTKSSVTTEISNSLNTAKTEIYSAIDAKDSNGNFISIADLKTLANTNGSSISAVANRVGTLEDNLSGFVANANLDSSVAALFSQTSNTKTSVDTLIQGSVNTAKNDIYSNMGAKDANDLFISIASLKTLSDTNGSSILAVANRVSTLEDNLAGFVASADLNSSVAQMFASSGSGLNSTAKANVVALVKDNKASLELTANDVNITAADINLNGYLTGGDASFKGDVEATSFTTGSVSEIGIGVMSGEFDESLANPNKAYFAYDSSQGGITMWYYQNNEWKRLNLTESAVLDSAETFQTFEFIDIPDKSAEIIPSNPAVLTAYYNRITGKYYTEMDTTSTKINGVYFRLSGRRGKLTTDSIDSAHLDPTKYGYCTEGICCIKEHKSNGTVVNSGIVSGDPGYSIGISPVRFTDGEIENIDSMMAVHWAVSDIYLNASGSITSVVVAPVVTSYTNDIWDTTGSIKSFTLHKSGYYYYNSALNLMLINGRFASHSDYYVFVGAKRTSIQQAINTSWDNYKSISQKGTATWVYSAAYPTKYPGDSGYPY